MNSQNKCRFWEKIPKKRLEHLVLPDNVKRICDELISEQNRVELLQSYGVEPRHKMLLIGPPGNGKTSLAEAIAEALMFPLLTVRYESIIGSYLGETAMRLSKLIDHVKTRQCVLFFNNFGILDKKSRDMIFSFLLTYIDSLPSYVIVIAATNHESLLNETVRHKFQIRLEIPKPTKANLEYFFQIFEKARGLKFGLRPSEIAEKTLGMSYAEAEELALTIFRQYVLGIPNSTEKGISEVMLRDQLKRNIK